MDHSPSQELESSSPSLTSKEIDLPLQEFLKKFETITSCEEKLQSALEFMRTSLSRPGSPYFKGFWEVRKLSLPLFKEGISPLKRGVMWDEYVELTREGRRLKSLSDEESAFAIEQIEIAIKSLEVEVEGFFLYSEEVLSKNGEIEFPQTKILESRRSYYLDIQRRLGLLNTYASHIHALRKELIKTEMRVRNKNKFFDRLSLMGDRIFPLRKELIREVSASFSEDVEKFVEDHFSPANFSPEKLRKHLFYFREEIKSLQACAKVLTLNTGSFTKTRESLSKCWDQLKGMEKELKKDLQATKQKSGENAALVRAKIEEILTPFKEGAQDAEATVHKLDETLRWMRDLELHFHDVRALKEELRVARAIPEAKKVEEEEVKKRKECELEEKRKEIVEQYKLRLQNAKESFSSKTIDHLSEELETLRAEFTALVAPKREKQLLERTLKEFRDQIEEKKEEHLLNLSDESKAAIDHLKEICEQRKSRKSAVKAEIEEYRRLIGGSSLDFEKAIEYGELMKGAKEKLEKIEESITEIEEKIRDLKKKP